jgi:hypothetical protein
MKKPGFLVVSGFYDHPMARAYLYVQPMGSDIKFTVGILLGSQAQLNNILGKVIIVDHISDEMTSVAPATQNIKTCQYADPFDDMKFRGSESELIFTGQYIGKKDGYRYYLIESIFILALTLATSDVKPHRVGEWVAIRTILEVFSDRSINIDEWAYENPKSF